MDLVVVNAALGGALVFVNAALIAWMWPRVAAKHLGTAAPSVGSVAWMVLLVGAATVYGATPSRIQGAGSWEWGPESAVVVAAGVALFTVGAPLILVDSRVSKLPDPLTALFAVEVVLATVLVLFFSPAPEVGLVLAASVGVWLIPIYLGHLAHQVGLGDVKLAPFIGLVLGTTSFSLALFGLLVAILSSGVHAAFLKAGGPGAGGRRQRFPLGPYLLGGAMFVWALAALRMKLPL